MVEAAGFDAAGGGEAGEVTFDKRSDVVEGEVADDDEGEVTGVGEAFAVDLERSIAVHTFEGS